MKHWVVCAADYGFWGRCVFFLLFDNSRVSDLLACRDNARFFAHFRIPGLT